MLGVLMISAASLHAWKARYLEQLLLPFVDSKELIEERAIGPYKLSLYDNRRATQLMECDISINGELWFTLKGSALEIGAQGIGVANAVGVGEDITGDGLPNVILSEYSGGAHCCWTYYVLSLNSDKTIGIVAVIHANHGEALFTDLDNDGTWECILADWTFAYWRTDFHASPAPQIVLQYCDGQYVPALHLMAAQPPSEPALMNRANQLRERFSVHGGVLSVPQEYWAEILRLIYSGHEPLAWIVADEAWPVGYPGKEQFLDEFRQQLARSPYWPAIRASSLPP